MCTGGVRSTSIGAFDEADTTIDKWSIGIHTYIRPGPLSPIRDPHEQLTNLLVTYGQTIFSRHVILGRTLAPP